MKRSSRYHKGYTSVFVLMLFVFIVTTCTFYAKSLQKQLSTIENLKTIREQIADEYRVILTFDALLKEYEEEAEYDSEGNEILDLDKKIIIDDFYVDGIYVKVDNLDSSYLLSYEDVTFKVYGDHDGIEHYEYY